MKNLIPWSPSRMLEITLHTPDDFLKIAETLTRIGIPSRHSQTLYQSCHILFKRGGYYIVSYQEMNALDDNTKMIDQEVINRRNLISKLLTQWGMCEIVQPSKHDDVDLVERIQVIRYTDRHKWVLSPKYKIGNI